MDDKRKISMLQGTLRSQANRLRHAERQLSELRVELAKQLRVNRELSALYLRDQKCMNEVRVLLKDLLSDINPDTPTPPNLKRIK